MFFQYDNGTEHHDMELKLWPKTFLLSIKDNAFAQYEKPYMSLSSRKRKSFTKILFYQVFVLLHIVS